VPKNSDRAGRQPLPHHDTHGPAGVVIGRKGAEIDKLKEDLSKMTGKEIYVDIIEIKSPEIDAQLVAENIALQLERRVFVPSRDEEGVADRQRFRGRWNQASCAGRLGGRNWPGWKRITGAGCRCTPCAEH